MNTERITLHQGFVYYYGNRAGYRQGDSAWVDTIFCTTELKNALREQFGLRTKETDGLYPRLLRCEITGKDGRAKLKFCRIWQWREDIPPEKKFLPYEVYHRDHQTVRRVDYRAVYDGYIETEELEKIFQKFSTRRPEGYEGRTLSMSDLIELYEEDGARDYYYVDEYGFRKLAADEMEWEE